MAILLALGLMWPISLVAQQQAQPSCAPYKAIKKQLNGKYKEGQAAIGLANNGHVFELFSSKDGKSWTIILTQPNGTACLKLAGKHLELIKKLDDVKGIEVSHPSTK